MKKGDKTLPRRKKEKVEEISDKIKYLGLDLENIPKELIKFEPLDFRISRNYDGKQYRQYRFLSVNDIEILLSPTNRLDDLQERYKNEATEYPTRYFTVIVNWLEI